MNIPDLRELFVPEAGLIEMFLRGTTIYWVLFLLLRIAGRRDFGTLGAADILVLVLVADAAGNALTGESYAIGDGVIVVGVIVGWSVAVDRLGYYSPFARRLLEPSRVLLIRNGRIVAAGLREEHLTRGELMELLRLKGVVDIREVSKLYIEANGEISLLTKEGPGSPEHDTDPEGE